MAECRTEVFADATDHDPIVVIGDIAHIEASSNCGPRANAKATSAERDQYDNLILLCKNCHTRLDGQKSANPVKVVRQLKADHEAWVRASLPERGRSSTGWNVFILQGEHPIDPGRTEAALAPDFQAGQPLVFTAIPSRQSWTDTFGDMEKAVDSLFATADPFDRRFAVFPLAPVSACISLGYLFTSRPRVRLFQYHRDDHTWRWPDKPASNADIAVSGLSATAVGAAGKLAVCFDLTPRFRRATFRCCRKASWQPFVFPFHRRAPVGFKRPPNWISLGRSHVRSLRTSAGFIRGPASGTSFTPAQPLGQ